MDSRYRGILELCPTDVAHGGYCVARHDGKVVFVSGTLPGERIRAQVTGTRSKLMYATTVEVLEASPDRIDHVWPLAEKTGIGGVDLGHVDLAASRRWKAKVIHDQFSRIAHADVEVDVEGVGDDDARNGLGWRTRIVLTVDRRGRLGMHKQRSHDIAPVDRMPIAHEDIQAQLAKDIASGSSSRPLEEGTRFTYARGSASGLVVDVDSSRSHRAHSVSERVETRYGSWVYDVDATGFWQVHRDAPTTLVEAVMNAAGDINGQIYDLYSGAGLFTLPLSDRGRVISVEGSSAGARSLRRNANGRDVECVQGDVTDVLSRCELTRGGLIVLDPPRAGSGRQAIEAMMDFAPDKVVYVACDPAALARDVMTFADHGYTVEALKAFDLFPHTHHVECVATMSRDRGEAAR